MPERLSGSWLIVVVSERLPPATAPPDSTDTTSANRYSLADLTHCARHGGSRESSSGGGSGGAHGDGRPAGSGTTTVVVLDELAVDCVVVVFVRTPPTGAEALTGRRHAAVATHSTEPEKSYTTDCEPYGALPYFEAEKELFLMVCPDGRETRARSCPNEPTYVPSVSVTTRRRSRLPPVDASA